MRPDLVRKLVKSTRFFFANVVTTANRTDTEEKWGIRYPVSAWVVSGSYRMAFSLTPGGFRLRPISVTVTLLDAG